MTPIGEQTYMNATGQLSISPTVYTYSSNDNSDKVMFGSTETPLKQHTPLNEQKGYYVTSYYTKDFGTFNQENTNTGYIDMNNPDVVDLEFSTNVDATKFLESSYKLNSIK